jgi:hypothetical protein
LDDYGCRCCVEIRRRADSGGGQEAQLPFPVLDRYLSGTGTGMSDAVLEAWLAEHPGERAELAGLKAFVQAQRVPSPETSGDAMWTAMERRMAVPRVEPKRHPWRVAAAVGAFAAGLVIVLLPLVRDHRGETTGSNVVANVGAVAPSRDTVGAPSESTIAAKSPGAMPAPAEESPPAQARSTPRAVLARADAQTDAGLARSPDDVAPPGGAVSLADDRPGAADSNWP